MRENREFHVLMIEAHPGALWVGSDRKLRILRRAGARARGGHGGGTWTGEGMVPGWVGWSQKQLLMDWCRKGLRQRIWSPSQCGRQGNVREESKEAAGLRIQRSGLGNQFL